jgi:CopG family nickel-responsive transcriptional regulator
MTRIAINIPRKLLNEFDEVLKEKGYTSRIKGLQDVIKGCIDRHQRPR